MSAILALVRSFDHRAIQTKNTKENLETARWAEDLSMVRTGYVTLLLIQKIQNRILLAISHIRSYSCLVEVMATPQIVQ
jgi:hypothetical protein